MQWRRAALCAALCGLALWGCSTVPREREEANGLFAQGKYEEALLRLDKGLQTDPDNSYLKSSQLRMQQDVQARLVLQAGEFREQGKLDETEESLQRAVRIDPQNTRVQNLLLDVARDRRQAKALAQAEELLGKQQANKALRVIDAALKDNPRSQGLLALKRKIELDQRAAQAALGWRLIDTRPISLEFRDAPVRTVLDVISRNSGVNFVFDKDVRNDLKTTVYLKQSRIEDALELIASTNQLGVKVLNGRSVLIYPNTPEKTREYQDLLLRVFYLAHADAKQVAGVLKSMLKLRDAQVDERLNTVMVRETPDTVRLIEQIVALQDVADPEVVLDVSVMEIATSRLNELGIKPPSGMSLTPLALPDQSQLTLSALKNLNSDRIGVSMDALKINLRAELGDVNLLANPKIRAKNREKAKVLIGDKIPIISSSTNTSSNFVTESIQYQDVGLKLEVEPTVTLDDEVLMKVNLEVSSLGKEVRTTNSVAYQIGTRTATTVLKLRDGETQLLAGLIGKEDRAASAGIPYLGELPIAGRLFSSKSNEGKQTEIVLAITPRIVRNVRRPDINEAEFWSGSETRLRMRPLALPEEPMTGAGAPAVGGGNAAESAPVQEGASNEAPSASVQFGAVAAVRSGEVFSVPVTLNSNVALRGVNLILELDPAQFEFVGMEEGGLFRKGNATVSATSRQDKESKALILGLMRSGEQGVQGNGVVANVKLKALKPGNAQLGMMRGTVVPESGSPLPLPKPAAAKIDVQ